MSRAGAGRSPYLRAESLSGVPDPGAVAVAPTFEAAATGVPARAERLVLGETPHRNELPGVAPVSLGVLLVVCGEQPPDRSGR